MNKNMFREYDIRGIYPEDINSDVAYRIGKSFASYIKNKDVIVGHDNRLSSPEIHTALINGLISCGANVIDLGLCTTPMYYVLKKHLDITNGIMITASHNPKEYNGFKISFSKDGNAYGKMIYDFRDFTFQNNYTLQKGTLKKCENVEEIYLDYIKKSINLGPKKIKVVYDLGNGTGSVIIKKVLDLFDLDYKLINEISDGNFPNHHPDPCEPKNMIELENIIKNEGFDLGIGIDGDADRVGVVDNNGNMIAIDKMIVLIYQYLYPTLKNKKAIMDVKCSKLVLDEMQKLSLPCEVYRTGNSYMNAKINSENFDFGGEFSGHLWFNDKWPGIDDGIYASLRIIEMLSNINEDLSTLTKKLPKYFNTPEIKITVKEEEKDLIIEKIKDILNKQNIKYSDIDGIRIDYDDGFALIRKSNTGPVLTVRFEKQSEEELEKTKNYFLDLINQIITSLK